MAATTANVAWPIQANSPSIPSFRKSLVPKNDFNVYKSLITQDKGSYINRMVWVHLSNKDDLNGKHKRV